jgi:RHS repeat-associated protein
VSRLYNDFGMLVREHQAHLGTQTASTPYVEYTHDRTLEGEEEIQEFVKGLRPVNVFYPDRTAGANNAYQYHYNDPGTLDERLNRPAAVLYQQVDSFIPVVTEYKYLGLGTVVETTHHDAQLKLDLAGPGHSYAGFDRFGRVVDQNWQNTGQGSAVDRYEYLYDKASSRTARWNRTASLRDERYLYDGLHRLRQFDRGELDASGEVIANQQQSQVLALDETGNWTQFAQFVPLIIQNRQHNPANEVTNLTVQAGGPAWAIPAHDANGNMTALPKPSDLPVALTCKYDGWNRLAEVREGSTTLAKYRYDALARRISTEAGGATRHFYYSDQWQVLEERVGSETARPQVRYAWGLRYVDDLIYRQRDLTGDGTQNERFYALQDANWNVTALAHPATGAIRERYAYKPYGELLVFDASWNQIPASAFDNPYTFTGRRFDSETGLYYYRHRLFHAQLGRFVTRDPIGYQGGANLYAYVANRPTIRKDPNGLHIYVHWEDDANLPWDTAQFFLWYFAGNGEAIDLNEIGLQGTWVAAMRSQLNIFMRSTLPDILLGDLNCSNPRTHGSDQTTAVFNFGSGSVFDPMIILGDETVTISYNCEASIGCVPCCAKQHIRWYRGSCSIAINLTARFANPLDWNGPYYERDHASYRRCARSCRRRFHPLFDRRLYRQCVTICDERFPPSEIPGGKPYDITATHIEAYSWAIDFGPCP